MSAAPVTLAELRTVDLFDELDDAALEPWVAAAEPLLAAPGEVVADAGMTPRGLLLLLEGTAQALVDEGSASQSVGRQVAPTWIGASRCSPAAR
jgi:hypothetical protein